MIDSSRMRRKTRQHPVRGRQIIFSINSIKSACLFSIQLAASLPMHFSSGML